MGASARPRLTMHQKLALRCITERRCRVDRTQSAGANSVESTDSSTTPLAASDTDIAISPRSTERTRTVVDGFILPKRDLLRDKEETSSAGQRRSDPLQNEPQFLYFCGTSLSLVAPHWVELPARSGVLGPAARTGGVLFKPPSAYPQSCRCSFGRAARLGRIRCCGPARYFTQEVSGLLRGKRRTILGPSQGKRRMNCAPSPSKGRFAEVAHEPGPNGVVRVDQQKSDTLLWAVIAASAVVVMGAVAVAVANEQAGTGTVRSAPAATVTTTTPPTAPATSLASPPMTASTPAGFR